MNDASDAAAEPAAVEEKKAKRGRPKKEGIKLGRKPRRDIFREAFGHPKAAIAVLAINKHTGERKEIVTAVKLLSSSTEKRKRLETRKDKLQKRAEKLQTKIDDIHTALAGFLNASAVVDKFRPRIVSILEAIGYGPVVPAPAVPTEVI